MSASAELVLKWNDPVFSWYDRSGVSDHGLDLGLEVYGAAVGTQGLAKMVLFTSLCTSHCARTDFT